MIFELQKSKQSAIAADVKGLKPLYQEPVTVSLISIVELCNDVHNCWK